MANGKKQQNGSVPTAGAIVDEHWELKPLLVLLIGLVAIVVIGAGGYALIMYAGNMQEEDDGAEAFADGRNLLRSGSPVAIVRFQEALDAAETPEDEAAARVNLATAYFTSSPHEAVVRLKEIVADESMPDFHRAFSVHLILQHYVGTKDRAFAQGTIFTGDTWERFYTSTDAQRPEHDRLEEAVKNAYEYSTTIQSTFLAEYRIAAWHANELYTNDDLTEEERSAYGAIVEERIENGNAVFPRTATQFYSYSSIAYGITNKGTAILSMIEAGSDVYSYADAKYEFEAAVRAAGYASQADVYARTLGIFARYHLATALAFEDATANQIRIDELATAMVDAPGDPLGSFVRAYSSASDVGEDNLARRGLIAIGNASPYFQSYLLSRGFSPADF